MEFDQFCNQLIGISAIATIALLTKLQENTFSVTKCHLTVPIVIELLRLTLGSTNSHGSARTGRRLKTSQRGKP